jgi:hypothetical protein
MEVARDNKRQAQPRCTSRRVALQVFTAIGMQLPGAYLHKGDKSKPLGPIVTAVYRSWAFMQNGGIEEFRTDDGQSARQSMQPVGRWSGALPAPPMISLLWTSAWCLRILAAPFVVVETNLWLFAVHAWLVRVTQACPTGTTARPG